jgi:hypothetical protein
VDVNGWGWGVAALVEILQVASRFDRYDTVHECYLAGRWNFGLDSIGLDISATSASTGHD